MAPRGFSARTSFRNGISALELYAQSYNHPPAQAGKPGCIHFEQPLLPVEKMRPALEQLREQGYILGVATGRPGVEGIALSKIMACTNILMKHAL